MKTFKTFNEELTSEKHLEETNPNLYNFLCHLSSPILNFDVNEHFIYEAASAKEAWAKLLSQPEIAKILEDSLKYAPTGNVNQILKKGFNAALADEQYTTQKALQSVNHFRRFMIDRGGYVPSYNGTFLGQNSKTKSSEGEDVYTKGISLVPSDAVGYFNMCPNASTQCVENCLTVRAGGNRQYPVSSFKAKLLRNLYLLEHPDHAARIINFEIDRHEKEAAEKGMKPGIRLNVTSDLPWEHLMPKTFFTDHPNVQFYDYTKNPSRALSYTLRARGDALTRRQDLPDNYALALSHTGTGHPESNDKNAIQILQNGGVVAMVYNKPKSARGIKVIPKYVLDAQSGAKYPVVDGDSDDNIFDRHRSIGRKFGEIGIVSGLKVKGVDKEAIGSFANDMDDAGVITINR